MMKLVISTKGNKGGSPVISTKGNKEGSLVISTKGRRPAWRNLLSILTLAILLTPSCKRIPLYDPESGVYLKTDIKLAIDVELSADIEIDGHPDLEAKVYGKMPEMIRACFYDTETHRMVHEEYLPAEGGFVNIGPGVYDLIVYSLGTLETQTGETGIRGSAYAFTSKMGANLRMSSTSDETNGLPDVPVIYEPDHIFVGSLSDVEVPVRPAGGEPTVIEVTMPTLIETYTLEVINVVGAGNIQKADIYITGQAPSKFLWDAHFNTNPCAIYFQSFIDTSKGHLFSVFNTFGKLPGIEADCFLNVLVTTNNGGRYQWVFDLTDQFDDPDNTGHELIINEDVIIPDESSVTGGFVPTVHDWDVEIIYVPID